MQGHLKVFKDAVALLVNINVLSVKLVHLQHFTYVEMLSVKSLTVNRHFVFSHIFLFLFSSRFTGSSKMENVYVELKLSFNDLIFSH